MPKRRVVGAQRARPLQAVERRREVADLRERDVVGALVRALGSDPAAVGWIAKPSPVAGRKFRHSLVRSRVPAIAAAAEGAQERERPDHRVNRRSRWPRGDSDPITTCAPGSAARTAG